MKTGAQEEMLSLLREWGRAPAPEIETALSQERERRGTVTLAASIRAAKNQRAKARRVGFVGLSAAAAVALTIGAGLTGRGGNDWGAAGSKLSALFGMSSSSASQAHATPHRNDDLDGVEKGSWGHGEILGSSAVRLLGGAAVLERGGTSQRLARAAGRQGTWTGMSIAEGDTFRAETGGAEFAVGNVTTVQLDESASITVRSLTSVAQYLVLEDGEARFQVDPHRKARVTVEAGGARVMVTGTEFLVRTEGGLSHRTGAREGFGQQGPGGLPEGGWTEVEVTHGQVKVSLDHDEITLNAGDRWSTRPSAPPVDSRNALAGRSSRSSVSASSPMPGETTPMQGESQNARSGASTLPVGGSEARTTLARENELFRAAVTARNRGAPLRCVSLLGTLLSQHPRTPLRQEALVAKFRCQAAAGQMTRAGQSAASYLAEYPSGFARQEARELVLSR